MAPRVNYNFQKAERERAKQAKKDAKKEAKAREKAETGPTKDGVGDEPATTTEAD